MPTKPAKFESGFDWSFYFQWLMATSLGWLLAGFLLGPLALPASGVAIGVFQWLVLVSRIAKAWRWAFATSLGWFLGWAISYPLVPTGLELVTASIIGLTTGLAQWWVLRRELRLSGWWIIISLVSWTTGLALLPGLLTSGVLPAAISGLAFELLYRNTQLHQPAQYD